MMLIYFRPDLAIRNSLQSQISFEAGLLKYHCHPLLGAKTPRVYAIYIYIYTHIDIHIHASGISIYATCHPSPVGNCFVGNLSSSPHLPLPLDKVEPGVDHYLIFGALPGTLVPNIGFPGRPSPAVRQEELLDHIGNMENWIHSATSRASASWRLLQLGRVLVRSSWIMLVECP